jgi:tetratricopeptide (TPR) repeat protein
MTERMLREAERLYLADEPAKALSYLEATLDLDERCYEALVMAGELYDLWAVELELTEEDGAARSILYYERAIAARPECPEAYAGKALAHLHLRDARYALEVANQGIKLYDEGRVDFDESVWSNIGQTLFRVKALALKAAGCREEGRQAAAEGLSRFPESEYLSQILDEFLPNLSLCDDR